MNKNKSNNSKGIVVALKANFLIVEIDYKHLDENIFASSHIENQTSKKLKYVKKGISYNLS